MGTQTKRTFPSQSFQHSSPEPSIFKLGKLGALIVNGTSLRQYHSRSAIATTINDVDHRDRTIVGIQYLLSATFSRLDRVEPRWRRHRFFVDSLSNESIYTLLPSQLHFFPIVVHSDPSSSDPLRICFAMSLTLAAAIKSLIRGFKHSWLASKRGEDSRS